MPENNQATESQKGSVTIVIVGPPKIVIFVIDKLHRLGFVKISEWTLDENINEPDRETEIATIVFTFTL